MEEKMKSGVERKSEIPSDIISDIFSWLPVKSLCRFKCVSRFYNSLVSDPSFVDIHQSRSKYPPDKIEFLAHSREKNFYTVDLKVEDKKASALCIKELDGISCTNIGYVNGSCSSTRTPHGEIVLIVNTSFKPNRMFFYDLKKKSWRSEIEVMELEGQTEIIAWFLSLMNTSICIRILLSVEFSILRRPRSVLPV
ncbi:putative F-box protein At1g50870 [Lycium ferocissimum]|uniref:putative F-box protein At1g50870 n=1 Tax=Lycium ferocissimum TaxID=112874 RepID=UPI002816027E|nr:putative F-box protein At1g50870 [Lycium ferocissimum]